MNTRYCFSIITFFFFLILIPGVMYASLPQDDTGEGVVEVEEIVEEAEVAAVIALEVLEEEEAALRELGIEPDELQEEPLDELQADLNRLESVGATDEEIALAEAKVKVKLAQESLSLAMNNAVVANDLLTKIESGDTVDPIEYALTVFDIETISLQTIITVDLIQNYSQSDSQNNSLELAAEALEATAEISSLLPEASEPVSTNPETLKQEAQEIKAEVEAQGYEEVDAPSYFEIIEDPDASSS